MLARRSLLALLGAVLFYPAVGSASIPVESKISEVTIYPDRARVTRVAAVDIPGGISVLEFAGLPANLDERSIIVSGETREKLTIEGVDLQQEFLTASSNPRVKELEDRLEHLQNEKKNLEAQRAVLEEKRAFFRELRAGLAKSEKATASLDDIRKLYGYYADELSNISASVLGVEASVRQLVPEIDRVQKELDQLLKQKVDKKILVSVRSEGPVDAHLKVQYGIAGASWLPTYSARVNSATGKVDLAYDALVCQRTGEDWTEAKLTVSTARPGQNGQMPELEPEYVDFVGPALPVPAMADEKQVPKPEVGAGPARAYSAPVEIATATLQLNGLSVIYDVALPVTIPSDGEPHRASLALVNLGGEPVYAATPKREQGAFLKLHVTNTSQGPLLPGGVDIYRDGDHVANLVLKMVPAGSEFDLFCGRDDAIRVERKELLNRHSETGIISKREISQRKYQIVLENFRTTSAKLSVYDQIPVSRDSQIVVNAGNFSDQPTKVDKDTGKITWDLTLKPSEKKVLEFEYSIDWPKGKEIEEQ